jgi:hypothetical protein
LFEIADPEHTELLVEVEAPDAIRVSVGLDVTVRMPGGRETVAQGRMYQWSPRVAQRTIGAGEARVRAESSVRNGRAAWISPQRPSLPVGMRLEAWIHLPPKHVGALVPRSAISVRNGYANVDVVDWNPLATRRVILGAADDLSVEVFGVAPGTRVHLTNP